MIFNQVNNNIGSVINTSNIMTVEDFEFQIKSLCERDDIDLDFKEYVKSQAELHSKYSMEFPLEEYNSWFTITYFSEYHRKGIHIELFDLKRDLFVEGKDWQEVFKKAIEAFDNREYK